MLKIYCHIWQRQYFSKKIIRNTCTFGLNVFYKLFFFGSSLQNIFDIFQKVEKLRGICSELEAQIKDLEALQSETDSKESEWNKMRLTYEKALEERENDLEGANQRLNVLKQFRWVL